MRFFERSWWRRGGLLPGEPLAVGLCVAVGEGEHIALVATILGADAGPAAFAESAETGQDGGEVEDEEEEEGEAQEEQHGEAILEPLLGHICGGGRSTHFDGCDG